LEERMIRDPEQGRALLARTRAGIGELTEEVRKLSHRLHPSVIDDLGIAPALRSLLEDFREREQMIGTFTAHDVPAAIPNHIATGIYRITQEALRNVAKHAGKAHVKVLLRGSPGSLRLQISDSGMGFNVEEHRSGLGFINMEERARMMEGTFQVESEIGEGTRVMVEIPLRTEN
jgi:two-component system, chemotaxis family, CheB/CheR fusion protein